jgi:hypothetical protein
VTRRVRRRALQTAAAVAVLAVVVLLLGARDAGGPAPSDAAPPGDVPAAAPTPPPTQPSEAGEDAAPDDAGPIDPDRSGRDTSAADGGGPNEDGAATAGDPTAVGLPLVGGPAVVTTLVPAVPTGRFLPAAAPGGEVGGPPFVEYSVAAEEGAGIDPDELAAFVDGTLADPRSWIGTGASGFRRLPSGGRFTVVVATPATVDRLCAPLQTAGRYSCGRNGYVALNLDRWLGATESWTASLEEYRRYLVNHEIGHYLGKQHTGCPGPGLPAPVMMQQSKGLDGCLPNGWPRP